MAKRGDDGVTLRTTLETVARMSGRVPDGLVNPYPLHPQVSQVWLWYMALSSGRQYINGVPQPIPEADIGWFFYTRRIALGGWEPDVIRMLDIAARETLSAKD